MQMHGKNQTLGLQTKKQKYFGLKYFSSQTLQKVLYQKDNIFFIPCQVLSVIRVKYDLLMEKLKQYGTYPGMESVFLRVILF